MKGKHGKKKVAKAAANGLESTASNEASSGPSRDFQTDLSNYVTLWATNKVEWKFNKILQNYALEHCLDKDKIGKLVFRPLLPYIGSIQGGARDRLLARMETLIESIEDGGTGLDAGVEPEADSKLAAARTESILKRAIQIRKQLKSGEE